MQVKLLREKIADLEKRIKLKEIEIESAERQARNVFYAAEAEGLRFAVIHLKTDRDVLESELWKLEDALLEAEDELESR